MKQIINGTIYNTETAVKLHEFNNDKEYMAPDYISETLYQKKSGEYFLYCIGGEASKYNKETIVPLSNTELDAFLAYRKRLLENS